MKEWRFDQGRLEYFQVDEIRRIAKAISNIDGISKPASIEKDLVRIELSHHSGLPFHPQDYPVWRNYGRVFECMLLATSKGGTIIATELCKQIAADPDNFDSDSYLSHFCRAFYYSSPIFQNYNPVEEKVYPGIAIIKYLISEYITRGKDYITIEEIQNTLIANNCSGLEDVEYYSSLAPKSYSGDSRQVRELVRFISQLSFLKWDNPKLYLEVKDKLYLYKIEKSLTPIPSKGYFDAADAILEMAKGYEYDDLGEITATEIMLHEDEFIEGKKIRATHIRSERSSKLKLRYFNVTENPQICRMCDMDTRSRYPWANHVIELHHLLPLSSPIRVEKGSTSIKDLVGLCPSCHSATHKFYAKWFKENSTKDFSTYEQAHEVYNKAKSLVKIGNV